MRALELTGVALTGIAAVIGLAFLGDRFCPRS